MYTNKVTNKTMTRHSFPHNKMWEYSNVPFYFIKKKKWQKQCKWNKPTRDQ